MGKQKSKSGDFFSTVTYKGEEYRVVFNLNSMEEIQEQYGSVQQWGELFETDEEPKIKDVKFGFMAMLNEGIDIWNDEHADDEDFQPRKFFNDKQVGRLISDIGMSQITQTIRQTVVESTKSDEKN